MSTKVCPDRCRPLICQRFWEWPAAKFGRGAGQKSHMDTHQRLGPPLLAGELSTRLPARRTAAELASDPSLPALTGRNRLAFTAFSKRSCRKSSPVAMARSAEHVGAAPLSLQTGL